MAYLEEEPFNERKLDAAHLIDKLDWVPFSLTLVEYPQGDLLGKLLALISLTPFAIIAGFVALVLFRRDLHTITFFGGITINEAINFFLKHTLCEDRPMKRATIYIEYGMPSSHSQFIWFFAAYTTLFVCIRLHYNNNSVSERFWRATLIASCIVLAVTVSYSRTYLEYHTMAQVLCGAIIGCVFGVTWFAIVHLILTPFFPVIVTWRLSEYLLLRDTTLIPNVLWFEYTNIRAEARARSRKLVSMKSQ
ncbi:dolichyldiphosphatase 1 [Orussus abietinus]|uniref:dolichyldiphosphatase 1 n=1 Tax=Orussus abietinus TaxID=222816 RepID=UPI0006251762|nr:dolichyldiphosphatase 1 [Orussus abietinus]